MRKDRSYEQEEERRLNVGQSMTLPVNGKEAWAVGSCSLNAAGLPHHHSVSVSSVSQEGESDWSGLSQVFSPAQSSWPAGQDETLLTGDFLWLWGWQFQTVGLSCPELRGSILDTALGPAWCSPRFCGGVTTWAEPVC